MKLLVIGSGGREHALAWRLSQSAGVEKVFVAPGNAGTALEPALENIALKSNAELIEFVRREGVAFTVVGPEAPLAAGVVDDFRAAGLKIFGPTKAAAQLESSKDFAKAFMKRHRLLTTKLSRIRLRLEPMWKRRARRLSLRQTGWLRAKGWSWP